MEHLTPARTRRPEIAVEPEERFGRGLTPRRQAALTAYLAHGTYAAAARESGLSVAAVKRLIDEDKHGQRFLRDRIETASAASNVTVERVLTEFGRLAFGSVVDLLPLMERFDNAADARATLADLPPEAAALIKEVEFAATDDGAGMKLKLHDKMAALNALARTLAMFVDRVEVTDNTAYGDRLRRAVAALEQEETPE